MCFVPYALSGERPGSDHADEEVAAYLAQRVAEVDETQAVCGGDCSAGIRDMTEASPKCCRINAAQEEKEEQHQGTIRRAKAIHLKVLWRKPRKKPGQRGNYGHHSRTEQIGSPSGHITIGLEVHIPVDWNLSCKMWIEDRRGRQRRRDQQYFKDHSLARHCFLVPF